MNSSNPVLSKTPVGVVGTGRMTIESVITRSAMMLGLLAVTGALSWLLNVGPVIGITALIAAFVIGLVASFKKTVAPGLYLAYAGLEGIALGWVSSTYETLFNGVVVQALLGVGIVFGVMLALYRSGKVRATPKFARFLMIAAISFVGLMLVNLVASFIIPGGLGLTAAGPLGLLVAAAGVVIGSLFYILDFSEIEDGVRAGLPENYAWRSAFGLTLTTVWVYVEMLRLISIIRSMAGN